ncbi:MAG: GDSL-type esterase/lipase family protein [Pseudomonadota bacterium]
MPTYKSTSISKSPFISPFNSKFNNTLNAAVNFTPIIKPLALTTTFLVAWLGNIAFAQPPRAPTPAPVPGEVTMARPTDAEVEQAQASLATFLSGLDADDKRIFDAYPYLLEVRPPGINTALVPNLSPNFNEKHAANVAVAKAGDIDVLFMGDSITDFWRNETGNFAGKPVFDKYFGNMKVANFGIAGDTTQGVLYRLQNGEGQGFTPKAVMLMIGTNNTRTHRAEEIAEGVGAVVLELKKNFPGAKILLLGIFPRSTPDDPVRAELAQINSIIAKLDDNQQVFYKDIGAVFLDAEGKISPEIMTDGLHPTTKGYELWAEAIKQPLADLL